VNSLNTPAARQSLLSIVENCPDIDGRFADVRRIGPNGGNGQFSLLFSALDTTTGQRVALKFFNPARATEAYRMASFEREEQLLHSLVGQRDILQWVAPRSTVIQVVQVLQAQGLPPLQWPLPMQYYAIELASTSVGSILANGQWGAEKCLVAFRAMCRAIQRIHSSGIAHRDLKPDNFLVMRDGAVKLADFGTARRFDVGVQGLLQQYMMPVGDPWYSAPELLAGLHDEKPRVAFIADIFALGATLFEMFAGTQLAMQLYDQQFENSLQLLVNVPIGQRKDLYDQLLPTIVGSRPLPSVAAFGVPVPACIRNQLDDLYRSMSSLDYRSRLHNYGRIFRQIDICLKILRNEQAYRRWRNLKIQRRHAAIGATGGGRP